jgi:hypothetical protein
VADCGPGLADGDADLKSPGLVKISLGLAIFLEVLPTEADVLSTFMSPRPYLPGLILAKLGFLTLILAPLFQYIRLNGRRGVKAASGKIKLIALILAFWPTIAIVSAIVYLLQ